VYQSSKTYEDGEYLVIHEDYKYPVSVNVAYGQIVDSNGISYDDAYVKFISPSFEVIHE
jgi:hypothetical protein